MFKQTIKALTIAATLLVTTNAMADVPWVENQGLKPSEYNSSLVSGQWVVKEGQPIFKNFRKKPKFVIISPASINTLDATVQKFIDQGLRTERLHTVKTKSYVKSILATDNELDYINKNYSVDSYESADKGEIDRLSFKGYNDYVTDNGENAIMLSFYNKKSLIYGTDAMALTLFRNYEVLPDSKKAKWEKAIKDIEDDYSFDIKSGVDFFFLGTNSKLMAMDVVSDDMIILYQIEKGLSITLVKAEEMNKPISYDAYFQELEN